MRIFAVKTFERFRRKERIGSEVLIEAIDRASRRSIDADLGGGLIKQRVARQGEGKRGGFRTIVAHKAGKRAIFLCGFAKNAKDNIGPDELADWRLVGADLLKASDEAIKAAVAAKEMTELYYD